MTQTNNNIPDPDPNWDYYEIWKLLHIAQFKIQTSMKLLLSQEQANNDTDQKVKETLETALQNLELVIDKHLTGYTDDEVYE
jgi:hypothetical protein